MPTMFVLARSSEYARVRKTYISLPLVTAWPRPTSTNGRNITCYPSSRRRQRPSRDDPEDAGLCRGDTLAAVTEAAAKRGRARASLPATSDSGPTQPPMSQRDDLQPWRITETFVRTGWRRE